MRVPSNARLGGNCFCGTKPATHFHAITDIQTHKSEVHCANQKLQCLYGIEGGIECPGSGSTIEKNGTGDHYQKSICCNEGHSLLLGFD